ncbi:MAG TPA: hypothetical protein DHW83_00660 [Bacteroidales bacterium]|nr:hypothetical protein [Bacteroidales bacterium]
MKKRNLFFILGIIGGIIISLILIYASWPNLKYLIYNEKFISMAPMIEKFHYNIKYNNKKIINLNNNKYETNIKNSKADTLVNENLSNMDSLLNELYDNILDSLLKIEGYRYIDSLKLDSLVRLMVIDSIEKKLLEGNRIETDSK